MKKILAWLIMLSLLTAMLPTVAAAEKHVESGYKYTVENGEATIVGYTELPDVLHIPEVLGGYPVTTIAEDAIWLSTLREVYIPESVRFIDKQAFYSSAGMTIYLPDSDLILTSNSFHGAERIFAYVTPKLELQQGRGILYSYEDFPCAPWQLEPITEDGLTYALYEGEAILLSAEEASVIRIPEMLGGCPVTSIGSHCFSGVAAYRTLELPDSIRRIGYAAASGCYNMKLQRLPASLEYIGDHAFDQIVLTEQTMPESLKRIGSKSFENTQLPNLQLNEGLEYIGDFAFLGALHETKLLTIPESVKYIGAEAFCAQTLRIRALTRDAVCKEAFDGILWLIGYSNSSVMRECGRAGVPFEDIETGERYEFSYKTTIDGITYRVTEELAELQMHDKSATDVIVTVPETVDGKPVEIISSHAFDNDVVEAVFLPDTVKKVESYAFDSCENLYYIRMSHNLEQIEQNAFSNCYKFKMLYLPPSFTKYVCKYDGYDSYLFWYHGNVARVIAKEGSFAEEIARHLGYTFIEARDGYEYMALPSGVYESDGKTATMIAICSGMPNRTLTVPDEVFGIPVTKIASGLIYPNADNDISYETIVLGNNIVSVGEGAFSRSNLRYLHLGRNVQTLHYPLLSETVKEYEHGIYGYAGTYAQQFARTHGYMFYPYDSSPFYDVPLKAWYHEAVSYCYWRNLLSGTSKTTFEPEAKTTRAMVAQILYNLSGRPYISWNYGFKDIDRYDWFNDAVNWCRYYGLAYGTTTWYFSPNDYVTREQVATFFYRYAEVCGLDVTKKASLSGYYDAWRVSDYAKSALQWAVANKIMVGNSPTTLNPKGYATRAEIAMIIMNFANYVSSQ